MPFPPFRRRHANKPQNTAYFERSGSALLYNLFMARGWESKAVEEQVELNESKPFIVASNKPVEKKTRTSAEIQNLIEQKNLQLARAKVQRELQAAQNPRYAEMLRQALAELDGKLAKLAVTP